MWNWVTSDCSSYIPGKLDFRGEGGVEAFLNSNNKIGGETEKIDVLTCGKLNAVSQKMKKSRGERTVGGSLLDKSAVSREKAHENNKSSQHIYY